VKPLGRNDAELIMRYEALICTKAMTIVSHEVRKGLGRSVSGSRFYFHV
jgi:hypothetical protein